MVYGKVGKTIQRIFKLFVSRYQIGLEDSIKDSDFVFDCVNLLHFKYHKITLKCGGSYIVSPDWIKKQKKQQKIVSMMMINAFNTR